MNKTIVFLIISILFFSGFFLPVNATLLNEQVDINVNIPPYTHLNITDDSQLFNNVLSGEVGLYLSDGSQVKVKSLEHFNLTENDIIYHENVPGIKFKVKTNYLANIKVESDFNWGIESSSAFLVFQHWAPYKLEGIIHKNRNGNSTKEINYLHSGEIGEEKEYKIGGAIYIESIDDQPAGTYNNEITITVDKYEE